MRVIAKAEQRRDIAVRYEPDVAAVTAVTTIRAALGDVGFATERDTSRASITGLDM
jgi:hypothetical protein